MPTFPELLSFAKREIREVSAEEVRRMLGEKRPLKLVDVREAEEQAAGTLPGAVGIPRGFLEMRIEEQAGREEEVVLFCAAGHRSALAARTLMQMGYSKVASLAGGYLGWQAAGYPVEAPCLLSPAQRERYRRHLLLPEVGEQGQAALLAAKVLLLGAGGLGSPAALYLAAAGVGTLGVVDMDLVDLSNLQRQVLHTSERAGMPKTESARLALTALNPEVRVLPFQERLSATNALRILAPFDLVIDGGDNFPTRYLLNDACVALGKPNVHGSVHRFEGQVTVFAPSRGPCYRCLYPNPPPPELAPSCAEAGVLGVLPGVVGLLQANEAIKLILGRGAPLIGRLLCFDALATRFHELRLEQNPSCPVCRPGAEIVLSDEPGLCSGGG